MDDLRKARPVSGEIMTSASIRPAGFAGADVVDAEFETLLPAMDAAGHIVPPVVSPVGMDMLTGTATGEVVTSRGGPLFWSGGLALVAVAFWASGGHVLIRNQAATLSQRADLAIVDVRSSVDESGVNALLLVDGAAANRGGAAALLPALSIDVTEQGGRTTRYKLGTAGRPLQPGERFAFSSRLAAPKNGVSNVSVSFIE